VGIFKTPSYNTAFFNPSEAEEANLLESGFMREETELGEHPSPARAIEDGEGPCIPKRYLQCSSVKNFV
jgi:hypothetical protein